MKEQEDQYWDKIDDFLDGRMSTVQRSAFELQVRETEQLKNDLAFQQQLRQGIAFGSQQSLRNRLAHIQAEYAADQRPNGGKVVSIHKGLWSRWAVAAGLLVGALTILFLVQQPSSSSSELYASNYEPYQLKTTTRGPEQEDPKALAIRAYETQEYTTAIPRLEAAIAAYPKQAPLQLALAISQWEVQQQEAAQATLLPLLDHPLVQDQANWYAALFDLAMGNTKAAVAHLAIVVAGGGRLGRKAEALLRKID